MPACSGPADSQLGRDVAVKVMGMTIATAAKGP